MSDEKKDSNIDNETASLDNENEDQLSNLAAGTTQPTPQSNGLRKILFDFATDYMSGQSADIVDFGIKCMNEQEALRCFKRTLNKSIDVATMKSAFNQRKLYESLVNGASIFKHLHAHERMKLADVLVTKRFNTGDVIIKCGDVGDGMYFIEEGTVVIKMHQNDKEIEIIRLGYGQYFGALSLVVNEPYAASVYADSHVKVAFLEAETFERLLGPYRKIKKRNIPYYKTKHN